MTAKVDNNKRNSSVELFRIIATFLVLIVHFNGWFVGMSAKFEGFTPFYVSQTLIESVSCICVNCFLIITGWYGLKIRWKHIFTIWSIIAFIYVTFYLAQAVYTRTFSILTLLYNLIAIGKESYYVQSYLMLLFLSPILNIFIQHYRRSIIHYVLVFWSIEIILDYILDNKCLGFGHGYELTHFILIYLLCQTARLYTKEIHKILKGGNAWAIITIGILIIALEYVIGLPRAFAYTNPINILVAFSLFIAFERVYFSSAIINRIAASTLAVYIAHCNPPLVGLLIRWDNYALTNYPPPQYYLLIFSTILIVFIGCVCIDQIRILIFSPANKTICDWLNKKSRNYLLES